MDLLLPLRIVLIGPPAGVDFGLQEGKGSNYRTVQKQRSTGRDLHFDFAMAVNDKRKDGLPNFLGRFAQGPPTGRFVYIDVGQYAGQADTSWARRIKISLDGIEWPLIRDANSSTCIEAHIPGTGKDGGPSCGTVAPLQRWSVARRKQ